MCAQPAIYRLSEVQPGQHGIGRTVFKGSEVSEFDVEVLGVLDNAGPGQSIILAKLSGGPLEETGVMEGMSGSPVYIDGRLAGAIALGFENAKAAIAGIRPIEDMLRVSPDPDPARTAQVRRKPRASVSGTQLVELATPVSFSGFTAATLERFAPQLRDIGFDPRQGIAGGGSPEDALGDPSSLEPGSMISVRLMTGDMSVGADGTMTFMDNDQIYAFGHSFLSGGPTQIPFAKSDVIALLPATTASFKISKPLEWMGVITDDRDTGIAGIAGRRASMAPMDIAVDGKSYHMRVIDDPVMTPLLAQMAVSSALEATERTVGPVTMHVQGQVDFMQGSLNLDRIYSGDIAVSSLAANAVASPLSFAMNSGFDALSFAGMKISIDTEEVRHDRGIANITGPRIARPGEEIELKILFTSSNGSETVKRVRYKIPIGAQAGYINFTIADAGTIDSIDLQGATETPFRSPEQVTDLLNRRRSNTNAYLRVWRNIRNFKLEGRNLPAPPASVALILGRVAPVDTSPAAGWGSQIDQIVVSGDGNVISGMDTFRVEVRP